MSRDEWKVLFEGNSITVTNTATLAQLYINDVMQDQKKGLVTRADLNGQLPDGKRIVATIAGAIALQCKIYCDGELIFQK